MRGEEEWEEEVETEGTGCELFLSLGQRWRDNVHNWIRFQVWLPRRIPLMVYEVVLRDNTHSRNALCSPLNWPGTLLDHLLRSL